MRPLPRRLQTLSARERLGSQTGFALIEVMVSAALVAVVAVGVFAGIDGPAAISSTNQSRSMAVSLAQQDQDRMRGMRIVDLVNQQPTRTVPLGPVTYTVSSKSEWVTDASGASPTCSSNPGALDYLKITSTVTWPALAGKKPVSLVSLMAPPPGTFSGSLGNWSLQLKDQAGNFVPNVPVTLHASADQTVLTDASGCAFFGNVAAGSYTANFSAPGYTDESESGPAQVAANVTNGTTTTVAHDYAQAASIAVSFDTTPQGGTAQQASASDASVANSGIPAAGGQPAQARFYEPGGAQTTITATNLYPFTSGGYGVYAGKCVSDNPANFTTNYYTTNPGSLVTPQPGGSYAVTVHMPALNVIVKLGSTLLPGATVKETSTNPGCSESFLATTGPAGTLPRPEVPFGTYNVCAQNATATAHSATVSADATKLPGSPQTTLTIPTSGSAGACP